MTNSRHPGVVMITGGSAGVGRATARLFAKEGWRIGLLARGSERLEQACEELERMGGQALPLVADVGDAAAIEAAAVELEQRFGPIDVWINNAMVSVFSPVKEMHPEEYKRVTEVTYLGYVYGTLAALRRMRPRGSGVVVQVGSALAYRSIPLQSAYCAAKHAIRGFTDTVRRELEHDRSSVRVTMVQLPAVNTPQFSWTRSRLPHKAQPVPPIFQPEVPAQAIRWAAAHPDRREVQVGLSTMVAIESSKLAPNFGDHYLAHTGYRSQQLDEAEDPQRPDNLYRPVPGAAGAHGSFDDRAHEHSAQLWLNLNRRWLGWLGVGAVGAVGLGLTLAATRRPEATTTPAPG